MMLWYLYWSIAEPHLSSIQNRSGFFYCSIRKNTISMMSKNDRFCHVRPPYLPLFVMLVTDNGLSPSESRTSPLLKRHHITTKLYKYYIYNSFIYDCCHIFYNIN